MPDQKKVHLKILRRDSPEARSYWEEFEVDYVPGMNVISCLQAIQRNPVNKKGQMVRPVVWECNCLEEVCGSCTMVINGAPRQSCSALIDNLTQPIELKPLSKFPIVRDLMVDRVRMFDAVRKVKSWVPIDGTYDIGPGPKISQQDQQVAYSFSRCMKCGCCMEACPQFGPAKEFVGPATIAQAHRFNIDPVGKFTKDDRLRELMGRGGIQNCANAQNCVKVCPKDIPITDAIGAIGREATFLLLKDLLG